MHLSLGKAAYGLNRWADAIDHFEAALAENPTEESKNSILGELERAHARLSEASTGVYDLASIVDRCCRCPDSEQHPIRFDLANYTRLVRVTDIPGKGIIFFWQNSKLFCTPLPKFLTFCADKGLVVSGGPVKKGTLLFAEKAYAVGLPCMDLACMNWVTMEPSYASQVDCIIETVQKLCREPSSATELYSLWAGAGTRHQHGIGPPSASLSFFFWFFIILCN
jgi:hypothetical protein